MKIHHIGMIVQNISESAELYYPLGYQAISGVVTDPIQHNKLLFLQNSDSKEVLELIEPFDNNSSVIHHPGGYHHLCYEVASLAEFIPQFTSHKIGKIFTGQITAPAFNNQKIVFAYLKNGALIEFLETGVKHEF